MSKRLLEEPIELTDAELEFVSGGLQSDTGEDHEEAHEQSDTGNKLGKPRTEVEKGGLPEPF